MNYQIPDPSVLIRQSTDWRNTKTKHKISKITILICKFLQSDPRSIRFRMSSWRIQPKNSTQAQIIEIAYILLYNYIDSQEGNISKSPINPQIYEDVQREFERVVMSTLGCSKESVKKEVESLILFQQEIVDHQEQKNRSSVALEKFVFPLIIIVSIFLVFGFSIPQKAGWIFGVVSSSIASFMHYKSESAGSDELLYEKTLLKMLKNLKVDRKNP